MKFIFFKQKSPNDTDYTNYKQNKLFKKTFKNWLTFFLVELLG